MHDAFDVACVIAAPSKQVRNSLQIRNRVQFARRLLGAETAIQIAADPAVPRVAGQLADVIDVVDEALHADQRIVDFTRDIIREKHPGIEGGADHRVAGQQRLNLPVGKLAVTWPQGTAVVMTG